MKLMHAMEELNIDEDMIKNFIILIYVNQQEQMMFILGLVKELYNHVCKPLARLFNN